MKASREAEVAAAPEPIPVQAPMTPDQQKEQADARRDYAACLRQAAQYMSGKEGVSGDQASLVAPLCYAQFTRLEDALTAAMSTRDKRNFDRAGDKRQLDFATDAIRQSRGLASIAQGAQ
jgi:hypothetical protein